MSSPLREQHAFFHAKASHANAENDSNSSDDAYLFELSSSQPCPDIMRQVDRADKVAKYVAESEHPASFP